MEVIKGREDALEAIHAGAQVDFTEVDEVERVAQHAARLGMTADAAALMTDPTDASLTAREPAFSDGPISWLSASDQRCGGA